MSRIHGKPKSACCDARLRHEQNGEWPEQFCTKCGQPVDPKGQPYTYLVEPKP